ncbi:MAG: hypothetical protein KDI30_03730 [Pseudomonadales bacterium]|nr:hypothetical protein [Pseudomonadales bacterium]
MDSLKTGNSSGVLSPSQGVFADVNSDGHYEFVCENGHTSVVRLQEEAFQVMFEMGLHAINDRYYREAVVNFASSLENMGLELH